MKTLLLFITIILCQIGKTQESSFNYFPKEDAKYNIIHYENYTVAYSEEHEQAAWVAYELTKEEVERKVVNRSNDYREDFNYKYGSATLEDYKHSGYDRGHLAPAADFKFSPKAMSESFYLTNMSPQKAEFNRKIWLDLEKRTRTWATQNDKLYVIVGPVLSDNLKKIGPNNVSVPHYYYKILVDYTVPGIKAIAFLMKNEGSSLDIKNFIVPIDSIETITGIDFFPALEDYLENQLEAITTPAEWFYSFAEEKKEVQKIESSNQCMGIAKSTGKRCKINFGLTDNYCRHHQGQRR